MTRYTPLYLAILSTFSAQTVQAETTLLPIQVEATAPEIAQNAAVQTAPTDELLNTGNSESGAVLRQMVGVTAARKGGHGLDPQIRGQKQDQLNVLLEGAKIESGCPNRMDPASSYTEASSYDEIKVIRGVQSVEYGAGGSGGTILFQRHNPKYNPNKTVSGKIEVGKSNVMNYETNAKIQAVGKKGFVVIQGAKKEANNYQDGNGDTIPSSYNTTQGHIDLGWTPNANNTLKFSAEKSRTEDAKYAGSTMDSPHSEGNILRLNYEGHKLSKAIDDIHINGYHSTVDHLMDNYSLRTNNGTHNSTPTNTQTDGAKIKLTSHLNTTQLDYGIQFERVQQDATLWNDTTNKSLNFMWPQTTTTKKSAFLQTKTPILTSANLIAGLRYDDIYSQADKAYQAPNIATNIPNKVYTRTYGTGYQTASEGNLSGLLRFEQSLKNNFNWFTGFSHTLRTANATERYMSKSAGTKSWVGNPNLKPEEHNQFDLGAGQDANHYQWSASVWADQVHNFILRDLAKNQRQNGVITNNGEVYVNVDAQLYGADLSGTYFATPNLELGGNFSLTKGYNTTDHRNIAMMAAPNGSLKATYTKSKWNLGTRFNFALAQNDIDSAYTPEANHGKTPAWSTLDIFADYKMTKTWKLSTGVDNLFNQAYYDHLSYDPVAGNSVIKNNEPGQNIWAKVSAKF